MILTREEWAKGVASTAERLIKAIQDGRAGQYAREFCEREGIPQAQLSPELRRKMSEEITARILSNARDNTHL